MSIAAEIQRKIETAVAERDEQALKALLTELYEETDESDKPFDVALRLRPEFARDISMVAVESDAAMTWANRIARAARWVAYQAKTSGGFSGLRIVDEGDSWFQYPVRLKDTIDQLSADPDKAVFSLSAAGDLLGDMANRREYLEALEQTGARVMLLSGGGNDMLGGGRFESFLLPYQAGKTGADLLEMPLVREELRRAIDNYRRILGEVQQRFPAVLVFGHGYDVSFPLDNGRWLGKPLAARQIPLNVGRTAVEAVLEIFATGLAGLEEEFPNFRFIDLRGRVGNSKKSWFDELHPEDPGFGRVAKAFREAIAAFLAESGAGTSVESGEGTGARAPAAIPVTRAVPGVPVRGVASPGPAAFGGAGFDQAEVAPDAGGTVTPRTVPGAPEPGTPGSGTPESGEGRTIVLDPGHGGAPPPNKIGGSSWNNAIGPQGTLEKTLTFDVATRAKAILEGHGYEVVLTRTEGVNLSLAARAGVARELEADAFVSIHFNASDQHNAQGTETFVHTNHNDASRRLCLAVQAATVQELGLRDRNEGENGRIKKASFGVIDSASHAAGTAAVLLEVSFLDRVDEEERLLTEAYKDRVAAAIARGVAAYIGGGVESSEVAAEPEPLGDAIELAAATAGVSVPAFIGAAERAVPGAPVGPEVGGRGMGARRSWVSGSALPEAEGFGGFARQVAESLARARARAGSAGAGRSVGSGNDVHEFATVDPGRGFDVSRLGFQVEADTVALAPIFAGVESTGFNMGKFEDFIGGLGLNHFQPVEFLFLGNSNEPGGACGSKNALPPESLWPNIAKTARMLDEIRSLLGAPVTILSCYRNAAYNACIGGEANSWHMHFKAIDWTCASGDVASWHAVAKAVRASTPDYAGGIGRYDSRRFIHIDTRGGPPADWP